jgi:hypothetical protein
MAKSNRATEFVERIEAIDRQKAARRAEASDDIGHLETERKLVLQEAKDAGISPVALKAVVRRRDLERKAVAIESDLDQTDVEEYRALARQCGGSFAAFLTELADDMEAVHAA